MEEATTRTEAALTSPLLALYRRLLSIHGPQHWWPADSDFEMILGAYLTQNTSWRNVELAFVNLRAADKLSLPAIRSTPLPELEALLRPSGFFRQKAARIHALIALLDREHNGDLAHFLSTPDLRAKLLTLPGVGPETADCIVLYAARRPVFVIDLYTRRLLSAENIYDDALTVPYDALRLRVEAELTHAIPDETQRTQIFNEFHALIVAEGKRSRSSRLSAFPSSPPHPNT